MQHSVTIAVRRSRFARADTMVNDGSIRLASRDYRSSIVIAHNITLNTDQITPGSGQ